jgi:hypothetical protein
VQLVNHHLQLVPQSQHALTALLVSTHWVELLVSTALLVRGAPQLVYKLLLVQELAPLVLTQL